MKIYKIKTTAYSEEDFYLSTNLSDEDIIEVLNPIVKAERDNYEVYDNDMLLEALINRYPSKRIEMYSFEDIDIIQI